MAPKPGATVEPEEVLNTYAVKDLPLYVIGTFDAGVTV